MAGGAAVALTGVTITHFVAALVLVGFGWNFMYTGGTTLLTDAYRPAEKARTQGANDFIMFTIMGLSSFSLRRAGVGRRMGNDELGRAAVPRADRRRRRSGMGAGGRRPRRQAGIRT